MQIGAVQSRSNMPAYRDRRSGCWRYRKRIRLPDGSRPRIEGTPSLNTKLAAEAAERAHIERLLRGEPVKPPERKEAPTFEEFATDFMSSYAKANNKPSEQESKASILKTPIFSPPSGTDGWTESPPRKWST